MTPEHSLPTSSGQPRGGEIVVPINENLSLITRKSGLKFGTDAYLLYAFMKPDKRARAVELGSGTGVISLLAAQKGKFAHITAVELLPEYAELTARNAALNGLSDKITSLCRNVAELTLSEVGGECGAVFANPPYMRSESGRTNLADELRAARHESGGGIFDFCAAAARILKTGAPFYVVWRPDRAAELFCAMSAAGVEPKRAVFVYPDASCAPSLMLVEGRRGGGKGMTVERPLFIYTDPTHTAETEDWRMIYETGTAWSTA